MKNKKETTTTFSVRLPVELVEKLRQIGFKQDRSVNYLIRKSIEKYLEASNEETN